MKRKRAVSLTGPCSFPARHQFEGVPSMITSEQNLLLYELRQKPIPAPMLIELEARLQHRIHSMVLDAFNESGLSQKELTARLGWDTARVSRCLASSSNWTLKTISALLAAIGVDLDDPSYTSFDELERRLRAHASPSAAARPIKKQNRGESVAAIQLQLALAARQCSGATVTSIAALPVGAVSDLAETVRPKTQGAKVIDLLKYKQNASGQMLNIGVANAR